MITRHTINQAADSPLTTFTSKKPIESQKTTPDSQSLLGTPPVSIESIPKIQPPVEIKPLPKNPNSEIRTALGPSLKAYTSGLAATTKDEIDRHIQTLTTEIAKSKARVETEIQKRDALALKVPEWTTKDNELNELKKLIETDIPEAQKDQEKHKRLVARRDLLAQTYKRVGEDKLPDTQIQKAIDANNRLLATVQTQDALVTTIRDKETEVQAEIQARIENLETKKENIGLSEKTQKKAPEKNKELETTRADTSPPQIETSLKETADNPQLTIDVPITSRKLLDATIGPIATPPKQGIFSIRKSSYQKAAKQTGPGETLQTHLTFAENYAIERSSKAEKQSAEITTVVSLYHTTIHGSGDKPVTLASLLLSDDPQQHTAATKRLQDAQVSIHPTDNAATKLVSISNELISVLNALEKSIAKAIAHTDRTQNPEKDVTTLSNQPPVTVLAKAESFKAQQEVQAEKIERLPKTGLITKIKVGETIHRYIPYISDAPENSPLNALQALFGKPKQESFSEELIVFRCVLETSQLDTHLTDLKNVATVSPAAQHFLRQALLDIARLDRNQGAGNITANNVSLKALFEIADNCHIPPEKCQWLNDLDTPGTQAMPKKLAPYFLEKITESADRPISPNELLFIAALHGQSTVILEPQDDGTYTERSTPSQEGRPALIIEYIHGQYQRLDPLERQVLYTKRYTSPIPITVPTMTSQSLASALPKFGATFGETSTDTNITCWLEAAIYSAAYDPSASLITKMTEALSKNPPAANISPEKRAFLARYLQFLTAAKAGGHVSGIAALNQDVQTLYFDYVEEHRIRQHDPMDLLRPLHADLDTLLGATDGHYTRTEMLTIQSTEAWTTETPVSQTYNLYDRPVKLVGSPIPERGARESVGKRVPIAIILGNLSAGSISPHLTRESGSDTLRETEDGSPRTEAVIGKTISYTASSINELPSECHITVSRPYNRATGGLGKAPLLTPDIANTGTPYIDLPATIGHIQTPVRYNISQIIAHSGGQSGGHYVCYFQPAPAEKPTEWYKKTSNGNAATKLSNGYPDVIKELNAGNLTYTYMGVKDVI